MSWGIKSILILEMGLTDLCLLKCWMHGRDGWIENSRNMASNKPLCK